MPTLRGDYADLLILDEWQMMDETTWDDVGGPMLLDDNGKVIFVYTPPSVRSQGSFPRETRGTPQDVQEGRRGAGASNSRRDAAQMAGFSLPQSGQSHTLYPKSRCARSARTPTLLAYRQEILAEDLEEVPGALWNRVLIETSRIFKPAQFSRVAVGVDPPGGAGECGIIVAA